MRGRFNSLQGKTLKGRYLVQDFLEKGGMSSIYLAWDMIDKRHVVVKTLPRELADQPKLVERMDREGKAISSLNHPNIIKLYDRFRLDDGRPAIVLDFMQGGSIRTLLNEYREKNRAMPIDYALHLMIPVVDAMSFAHAIKIIHRDLKPTNILLYQDRRSAVVADLGIAKNLRQTRITKTNAILGTPYYMSYEQATGREVDLRTDIYSIGVILYEMVTTRRPFHVNNVADLLNAMKQQTPYPVTKLRKSAPPLLEKIIHKCLHLNPEDRYATMTPLLQDLKTVAAEHTKKTKIAPAPSPLAKLSVAAEADGPGTAAVSDREFPIIGTDAAAKPAKKAKKLPNAKAQTQPLPRKAMMHPQKQPAADAPAPRQRNRQAFFLILIVVVVVLLVFASLVLFLTGVLG